MATFRLVGLPEEDLGVREPFRREVEVHDAAVDGALDVADVARGEERVFRFDRGEELGEERVLARVAPLPHAREDRADGRFGRRVGRVAHLGEAPHLALVGEIRVVRRIGEPDERRIQVAIALPPEVILVEELVHSLAPPM